MVGDDATEADLQLKSIGFLESCGNHNSHLSLSYLKFSDFQWEKDAYFSCSYCGCDDKIRKAKEEPNTIINQKNLIIIYRTFYPITAEWTFFSSTYGTNTKIDHIKSNGVGDAKLPSPHRNIEKQTVKTVENNQKIQPPRKCQIKEKPT